MEINTCEDYVVNELLTTQKKLEESEVENSVLKKETEMQYKFIETLKRFNSEDARKIKALTDFILERNYYKDIETILDKGKILVLGISEEQIEKFIENKIKQEDNKQW